MLSIPTFGGAFLAGLVAFLSPCILPMVPFYLSYMAGLSVNELKGERIAPGAQLRLVLSAMAFALGVTTIFMLLGLGATALGQQFRAWLEPLSYVAAGVLVLFGLHFLGILRIPLLYREARLETSVQPTTVVGAYVMGLAFGFGWTPCVGPALAAILMVASAQDSLMRGVLLLAAFGIGMTAPFVIAAFFARLFMAWLARNRKYMGYVEKAMGVMLIVFALLIVTGGLSYIADWMIRSFEWSTLG